MADAYTKTNLRDGEDMAAKHGFGEQQEARFPYRDLDAEATGLGLITVKPGQRQPFAHRHNGGGGGLRDPLRLRVDQARRRAGGGDRRWTRSRISPSVGRAAEAGPDGLEILAVGPRHEDDAEIIKDDFWSERLADLRDRLVVVAVVDRGHAQLARRLDVDLDVVDEQALARAATPPRRSRVSS